jgi:hypothetical protein
MTSGKPEFKACINFAAALVDFLGPKYILLLPTLIRLMAFKILFVIFFYFIDCEKK